MAAGRLLIDTESVVPGVTKINLRGRLDATGVQTISPMFERMALTQHQLIVDLSRVSFIASTGLRTLISASRAIAARDGKMVFLRPEPSVASVLIASGVDTLIPIFQELTDAVCAVSGGGFDDDQLPSKSLSFSLQVERSMRGVARVGAWVDELALLLNLAQRTEYALRLCLEEAVTNVVTHAAPVPGINADDITLRLVAEQDKLSVTVQDHCAAYDPLCADPTGPDQEEPSEGGLGIGLLRQHAREVTWSRLATANRLAFTIPR